MTDPLITAGLIKLAPSILSAIGKKGLEKLFEDPLIAKAINDTGEAFPGFPAISDQLTKWCSSEEFGRLLEALQAGERDVSDDSIVSEFIRIADFVSEANPAQAKAIVEYFMTALLEEIYASESGISTLANREEVQHDKTREAVQLAEQSLTARFDLLEKNLLSINTKEEVEKIEEREKVFHARIDEARDLINIGKVESAKTILTRVREETEHLSPSDELKFRISTNLGACALELNDIESLQTEFQEALRSKPHDPKALGNAAVAAFLSNDFNEALTFSRKALDIETRNPNAMAIHLQALKGLGNSEEIDRIEATEDWILDDSVCTIALGEIKFNNGLYDDAEAYARKSLSINGGEPHGFELLTRSIILPIQKYLQQEQPLRWRLSDEMVGKLNDALEASTHAIEIYEKYENHTRLHLALINRSVILSYIGNFEGALADCDRVLQENATQTMALVNKGMMLLKLDRFPQAIACLEKVEEEEQKSVVAYLAQAYIQNGQPNLAIQILSSVWAENTEDITQIEIAELLLVAYSELGDEAAINEITQKLEKIWPNESDVLLILAHQRSREGNDEQAEELFKKALVCSSGRRKDVISLDLANLYFSQGKYSDAAGHYGEFVDEAADILILQRYVISLFNSEQYDIALSVAETARGLHGPLPAITEVEALIFEHIVGDPQKAKQLLIKLSENDSTNQLHKIRIAVLDIRLGENEEALKVLSSIKFENIKSDPNALIQVAHARMMLGMDGVLPFAFRARRLAYGDPKIHAAYVWLFMNREKPDSELLAAEEVQTDTTVFLKSDEKTKIFSIIDDRDVNPSAGEITPNDPLARLLIGKKKGDQVVLRSGLEDLSYEVIDIQSKYVYAFQDTFLNFSTMFPENSEIQQINDDEHLSKMLSLVDERHTYILEAEKLYFDGNVPLCVFSKSIGVSIIDAWRSMMERVDGRLFVARGSRVEIERELDHLSHRNEVVLDFTSLLSIVNFELMDLVTKRFETIYVTQAVVDELNEAYAKYAGVQEKMTLWKSGEKYIYQETTNSAIEHEKEFLDRLKLFIDRNTTLLPVKGALKIPRDELEKDEDLFGKHVVDSIIAAQEEDLLFYSDDLGLKVIAEEHWSASAFGTQAMLVDMRRLGILGDDEYYNMVRNMLLSNYSFVSVDAKGLLWILRQNGMVVTSEVAKIFEDLQGPECDEASAVLVLADLIKEIWLSPTVLPRHRQWILDLSLKTLTKGRAGMHTIEKFKMALQSRLRLVPGALQDVYQNIDIWLTQHISV